jgi:hypothetical protein
MLAASWAFSFQPVLLPVSRPALHLFDGSWARRKTQSSELGFGFLQFLPKNVWTYAAVDRELNRGAAAFQDDPSGDSGKIVGSSTEASRSSDYEFRGEHQLSTRAHPLLNFPLRQYRHPNPYRRLRHVCTGCWEAIDNLLPYQSCNS